MSLNTTENVKCPTCGTLHTVTVWNFIDAKKHPDLKKDVLSRKINIFVCSNCGQTALMPSPLLYHDEEKKIMIYFAPCNDVSEKRKLFEDMKKKAFDETKNLAGKNLRFVSQYNELLEKILIFDTGLHDKVIELLKLLILLREPNKAEDKIVVFGKLENEHIEFLIKDESGVYTSRIPMSTYNSLEKEIIQSGIKFSSFDWEIVDLDYSSRLLLGMNNVEM
ncbi:MAG: CpXC domain-containing protein [Clostridia bacterium]|nr:CpXC domain-containing protein [Clostridia bacterium]